MKKKLVVPCLCLAAALAASGCGSVGADIKDAKEAAARKPEDGGTASGEVVQGKDVTKLTRSYAVAQVPRGGTVEELRLVLADGSIPAEVLASPRKLTAAAKSGDFNAVIVDFDSARKPTKATFFVQGVPKDLSVAELTSYTPRRTAEGSFAGHVAMSDKGFSMRYSADFDTPIYRPPQKPRREIPPNATAAEKAKFELQEQDLPFDTENFFRKVMAGDADAVKLYLQAGMSPEASPRKDSPLKDAVERGNTEVAKALIAGGANVRWMDEYDQTLVMLAVSGKKNDILNALIAAGADVNKANKYSIAPLAAAAEQGNLEAVKILLKAKARVNARNTYGGTALQVAVLRGYVDVVKVLIAAGADVKRDRKELLEIARREKHADVAKLIKEAK